MDKIVNSASDERIVNNSVRHQYRVLNEEEKLIMLAIKDCGTAFLDLLADYESREISLARIKIEEAVMWAVKSITK